jgi:pyruvate/2-oxoglutarate dehydrogenase complex dihydrolipoamide dehydrogenase (E3) component
VVIAAGARHAPLAIPGEEYLTTSTEFLDLDQLPRRVVFVGGGYIAFEFAHAHSGFKTLVEDGTERILGAHLLGIHAEEIVNIFALAVRAGLSARDLKDTVYAYPTSASDIGYMM